MTYTITSAKYANAANTAAVIHTMECGDVCIDNTDTQNLNAALAVGISAYVPPPTIDQSNSDNLSKALKAVLLASAAMSGKTAAQAKSAFLTAWNSLP